MVSVYRYGLLPPTEHADRVWSEMRGGHRYRNTLIEIERARRAAHRALLSSETEVALLERSLTEADGHVVAIKKRIAEAKSATRTAKVPEDLRTALDEARAHRTATADQLKSARSVARQRLAAARAAIDEHATDAVKRARANRPCQWGTGGIVEKAADDSRKKLAKTPGEQDDPRFVSWRGEGSIAVQLQGGEDISVIEGDSDTQLRIGPATHLEKKPHHSAKVMARRNDRPRTPPRDARTLYIRVGSVGLPGRMNEPIFAAFPMRMHQPIPPGARIKNAVVHLRMIGRRQEWYVCFTVERPDVQRPTAPEAAVAIDLGWRLMTPQGIRVARWVGSDGASGELRITDGDTICTGLDAGDLPARIVSGLRKPEGIQQLRDRLFNEARDRLVRWLTERHLPVWSIPQWKSKEKLLRLIESWPLHRFDDDHEIVAEMLEWRRNERHLRPYECDQRQGAERARREVYRIFSKRLGARYQTLVLEDFDLREQREPVESEIIENDTALSNKKIAAVSELRGALIQAFGAGHVDKLDPAYSTLTCHQCQTVNTFDAAKHLVHTCTSCGARWDQDINAAHNLLGWWQRERSGGEQNAGGARETKIVEKKQVSTESKWARAKRMRAEKEAVEGAARDAGSNPAE